MIRRLIGNRAGYQTPDDTEIDANVSARVTVRKESRYDVHWN